MPTKEQTQIVYLKIRNIFSEFSSIIGVTHSKDGIKLFVEDEESKSILEALLVKEIDSVPLVIVVSHIEHIS